MTNYRETDKDTIKGLLETITFDGSPLPVYTERTLSGQVPFCYIASTDLNPSEGGSHMHDTGHYLRGYGYNIYLIWNAPNSENLTQISEKSVDQLEADILDLLETDQLKYCQVSSVTDKWDDVVPGRISSPFSGVKVGLTDDYLVKSFPLNLKRETPRN